MRFSQKGVMVYQDRLDPQFDTMTSWLLQREALRRAANEINTTSGSGLEGVLARISAEVTAEAAVRVAASENSVSGPGSPSPPHSNVMQNDNSRR